VLYILLVLTIGLANFAIGFALAVHLGHGPAWTDLLQKIRPGTAAATAASKAAAKSAPAKAKAH
jgi:hypothetical protein